MRRPIRQEPVAEISGSRRSASIFSPTSAPRPITRLKTPLRPLRSITRLAMFCTATAVSGVLDDGFQTMVSPQTAAIATFQAQTATGKLKAVMMPIGPSGCHCSYIRCWGRSECIVRPYSWRDSPTAKSQTSIISWTSPRPSERILPISSETSRPSGSLWRRSSSPSWRTIWPLSGAGTIRQPANARSASVVTRS